jgi:hypothetical protein
VGAKECRVLNIAALVLAAATAQSPALQSSAPWWEKLTVTITGDGTARSCSYETSVGNAKPAECAVDGAAAAVGASSGGAKSQLTRITFERRFIPNGVQPTQMAIKPGDTLLGGQVMALAIDGEGAVAGCKIVAQTGEMTPDYGCAEAKAERFEARASRNAQAPKQAYMMVLVYGHEEQVA